MLRVLLPSLAVVAFACGGKAIIDPGTTSSGAGGATTSAASTTIDSTSASFGVTVTTTSSGMMDGFCDEACETLGDCTTNDGLSNCVDRCNSVPQPCREDHQRWMSCSLGETNTMCGATGPGQVCQPDLADYLACTNILLTESCGVDPNGGCGCNAFISPGVELDTECNDDGCRCLVGGVQVGFCDENVGPDPCGITTGCCAGIFFVPPIN